MAVYTVLGRAEIDAYARAFGLGPVRRARGVAGGTINTIYELSCARGRFILRVLENRPQRDARFEAAVLARLRERGLPVPRLCAARGGALLLSRNARQHVSIMTYLDGRELRRGDITAAHTEQVGELLARMHLALRGLRRRRANAFGPPFLRRLVARCREVMARQPRRFAREHEDTLAAIAPVIEAARHRRVRLPRGVVHGDLFTDNVRFAGGRLVGVIDFEMASTEVLAYDLVVALCDWAFDAGSLAGDRARALVRGYERARPLLDAERRALWELARFVTARYTLTRLHDFEVRDLEGVHLAYKDFRDYRARFELVSRLGPEGLGRALFTSRR